MERKKIIAGICSLTASIVMLTWSTSSAIEIEKLTGRKFAQLAWGGVLYDDWPAELGVKIDKTHPSYPVTGKKKGVVTWRCKECHGWDYKGRAGAYYSGSHYTGITGIRSYGNQKPEKIIELLKDETHAFGDLITEDALEALALFTAYGQVDVDLYIDRSSKRSIGDSAKGGRIFLTTCVKCHGDDGRDIDFSDEGENEYIGTVANDNPWETLHKIRWGHPGSPMISLLFLGLGEQLDVLSFCQTLPKK